MSRVQSPEPTKGKYFEKKKIKEGILHMPPLTLIGPSLYVMTQLFIQYCAVPSYGFLRVLLGFAFLLGLCIQENVSIVLSSIPQYINIYLLVFGLCGTP